MGRITINQTGKSVTLNRVGWPTNIGLTVKAGIVVDDPIQSGIAGLTLSGFSGSGPLTATGNSDFSVKAYFNVDTCLERFLLRWDVSIDSVTGEFSIGKDSIGYSFGTTFSISTDGNLRIYTQSATYNLVKTVTITGLSIVQGEVYNVSLRKDKFRHELTIQNSIGTTFTFVHDWPIIDADFIGNTFGRPVLYATNGTVTVHDFWFGSNMLNAKWAIFGDSFTENRLLGANIDFRWQQTLIDLVGRNNVFLAGRGGESVLTMSSRFSTELSWIDPDFVILAIGTNANSNSSFVSSISSKIAEIQGIGAVPILTTCVRTQQQANIDANNAWVRSSGHPFLEFANSLTTDSTNSEWKPGAVDTDLIHANVYGHSLMAERVPIDLAAYL